MFIIKTTHTATKENANFTGETQVWYNGKNYASLGDKNKFPELWEIREYGFTTKASAMRGFKAQKKVVDWEEKQGFWTVNIELVEVNL